MEIDRPLESDMLGSFAGGKVFETSARDFAHVDQALRCVSFKTWRHNDIL